MPPRSVFSGTLAYGLISAPVKLYVATEDKAVSLNLVHKECGGRIGQERKCKSCSQITEPEDLDRGYQLSKDKMIVLTEAELQSLPLSTTKEIEMVGFLEEQHQPDPIYYGSSYYMVPDDLGIKPFALIVAAMRESNLQGLAKVSLRHREKTALMRPMRDGRILLTLLYWGDEVRDDPAYYLHEGLAEISKGEMDLARQIVGSMVVQEFDPTESRDAYREAMQELIAAKLAGKEIKPKAKKVESKVQSLEEQLKATLAQAKEKKGKAK